MRQLMLVLLMSMSACATNFVKPGAAVSDWQRDHNDCIVKAGQAGYPDDSPNDWGGFKRNAFIKQCLEGQGWVKK